jgi:hypothetical protein
MIYFHFACYIIFTVLSVFTSVLTIIALVKKEKASLVWLLFFITIILWGAVYQAASVIDIDVDFSVKYRQVN